MIRAMDDLQKKRKVDDPARDRLMAPDGELTGGDGGANAILQSLQQTVGNTAVGSLLRATGNAPAGGQPATKTPGGGGGGFESGLFEQSILGPVRAAYACARDSPPDHERALQHLQQAGDALMDYEQRYRGSDDALANGFYAARGWLSRVARELGLRLGTGKPMTDQTIAAFLSDTISDLHALEKRLH